MPKTCRICGIILTEDIKKVCCKCKKEICEDCGEQRKEGFVCTDCLQGTPEIDWS